MDATTTPPEERRAGRRPLAPPPSNRKAIVLWLAFAVVALGTAAYFVVGAVGDRSIHHELPLAVPANAPTGEPLKVDYALQPGDVFATTLISKTAFVLTADEKIDAGGGMNFDVKLTIGHGIQAGKGAAPSSLVRVFVERADAKLGPMSEALWFVLGQRASPYEITFQRDAANRPDRTTLPTVTPALSTKRQMLDLVLAGLSDLSSNYLPARDVRRGEVWDLEEVGDLEAGIETVIRQIAQRQPSPEGFPPMKIVGKVHAEGIESRPPVELTYTEGAAKPAAPASAPAGAGGAPAAGEGEPCLRLGLYIVVTMEGDTNEPKWGPGFVSTAARISGPVWVSRSTGILWAVDLTGDVVSTYRAGKRPTEMKATMRIKSTTERAKKMPV
jgi:hypothetical protein